MSGIGSYEHAVSAFCNNPLWDRVKAVCTWIPVLLALAKEIEHHDIRARVHTYL